MFDFSIQLQINNILHLPTETADFMFTRKKTHCAMIHELDIQTDKKHLCKMCHISF